MAVTEIILFAVRLYEIILMARIIMSWVQADPYHPLVKAVYAVTEPLLDPIRRILPGQGSGIDFSPIVVFLLIGVARRLLLPGYYF